LRARARARARGVDDPASAARDIMVTDHTAILLYSGAG